MLRLRGELCRLASIKTIAGNTGVTVSWFDLIKIQRHCRSAKLPLLDRRMHVLVDACIGVLCWSQDESPSNAGQKNITIGDVAPMDFLTLGFSH